MISETLYTKGNNEFENGFFSACEWSAPYIVSPDEIRELVSSFNLEGRKIKEIRIIGLAYNLRREWIEDRAYTNLDDKELTEEEKQNQSEYENIDPELQIARFAEIDEPLLVAFEDGDVFEIDIPQEPEYRLSMNCMSIFFAPETVIVRCSVLIRVIEGENDDR